MKFFDKPFFNIFKDKAPHGKVKWSRDRIIFVLSAFIYLLIVLFVTFTALKGGVHIDKDLLVGLNSGKLSADDVMELSRVDIDVELITTIFDSLKWILGITGGGAALHKVSGFLQASKND